jgi:hypothetical protein
MNLPIEGTTLRLRYVAEMRDGSGVVDSGTDVHLKVHDVTADAWWTGAAWGVETELNGTHFAAGAWYYDLALADGLAGHEIEWVWYDEVDGTVVEYGACEVLGADTLVAAETGAQMDLVDAPNATAVTAIQDGLALEATLTAIKGAGWTDETLVAISAAIAAAAGSGARTLTFTLSDGAGTVAGSLRTHVEDADGNLVAGPRTTSALGVVTYFLDDGTYYLVSADTAAWTGASNAVVVTASAAVAITLAVKALPPPPAPGKYVVIINATDEHDVAVGAAGRTYRVVSIYPPNDPTNKLLRATEENPLVTDANGQASFEIGQSVTGFALRESYTDAAGKPVVRVRQFTVHAGAANAEGYIYAADIEDAP